LTEQDITDWANKTAHKGNMPVEYNSVIESAFLESDDEEYEDIVENFVDNDTNSVEIIKEQEKEIESLRALLIVLMMEM